MDNPLRVGLLLCSAAVVALVPPPPGEAVSDFNSCTVRRGTLISANLSLAGVVCVDERGTSAAMGALQKGPRSKLVSVFCKHCFPPREQQ